jgi:signal transduction histidine kinase
MHYNILNKNSFFILFEILIILFAFSLVYQLNNLNDRLYKGINDRVKMMQVAYRLKQSSDDLTKFARAYVVTGKKSHLRDYFMTLDIRNGEFPRPHFYNGVYWDLNETIRNKRHPLEQKISLNQIISKLPFSKEEIQLLQQSKDNSDDLVNLEVRAFKAMQKKEQKFATRLLFSRKYYDAQNKIMNPIDKFIITLNERTKNYIANIQSSIFTIYMLLGITLLFFIVGNYFIFKYIQNLLHTIIARKTASLQDLNDHLEVKISNAVEKVEEQNQQLIQQSRLVQMGEMVSMIAHQWRQPLSAISAVSGGITLKAKLDMLDSKTAIELSEKISEYAQHLSATINDFRDFFKPNKEKKDTTFNELVQSVLKIMEVSITNQNITLIKKLDSDVVFHTYPNELKQVILNLMKNAEDILLDNEIKNPIITIETKENSLSISDNGGGVPKDILDKIFDPYFSTKLEKNGTGLGLYMSKMIVEEHCNGELSVSNTEDGAIFTIKIKKGEFV